MIVAIDGPAGSGKTTIAKLVAKRLGFFYLDTGAIYRAFTLKLIRLGFPIDDLKKICDILDSTSIDIRDGRLFLDGEDVTELIRDPEVDKRVSLVAKIAKVRERLLPFQRRLVSGKNAVVEGRDMGTVVFPKAEVKVFLTASLEERARRRHKELIQRGKNLSFDEVLEDLQKRDEIDSNREVAPLKIASDAIIIDTTGKTIDEVVEEVVSIVLQRYKGDSILST
ncbi:MAG: (d)CMP kinase [Synergistetes bacterium]|nr:MAG: Cytidylate kinase [bacterium 42_11]MBC7332154.1 (d)CMP kinase [Synergistota bacterium]MDK2870946.1 CMP/dCMP kinase [bacterium]